VDVLHCHYCLVATNTWTIAGASNMSNSNSGWRLLPNGRALETLQKRNRWRDRRAPPLDLSNCMYQEALSSGYSGYTERGPRTEDEENPDMTHWTRGELRLAWPIRDQ
jgi:hypothetical protein